MKPLDGSEAWKLFRPRGLFRSLREIALRRKARALKRELDDLERQKKPRTPEELRDVIPYRKPGSDKRTLH